MEGLRQLRVVLRIERETARDSVSAIVEGGEVARDPVDGTRLSASVVRRTPSTILFSSSQEAAASIA